MTTLINEIKFTKYEYILHRLRYDREVQLEMI